MHTYMHTTILIIIFLEKNRIFRIYLNDKSDASGIWNQNNLVWNGKYNDDFIVTWDIDDISQNVVGKPKVPVCHTMEMIVMLIQI